MSVQIINRAGKTIYNRTHTLTSSEKIHVTTGSYNEAELMRLFYSAVSDVCYEFVAQFRSSRW
jgi:hypothetical protein